jgi:hypothetical protein
MSEPKKSKKIEAFLKANPVLGYDYETDYDYDTTSAGTRFDPHALHEVWLEAPYLFDGDRQVNIGSVKDFMTNCQYIEKIETKKEWEEITGSEYPDSRLDPSQYPELESK